MDYKKLVESLKIDKSIVFIDTETTGLDFVKDRIIEFSGVKVNVDGTETVLNLYINPYPVKSNEEAFSKHGLTEEFLTQFGPFKNYATTIHKFLEDSHVAGYNIIKFDLQFLLQELERSGISYNFRKNRIIDIKNIYQKVFRPGGLEFAHKFLTGNDIENAHHAESDVRACMEVLNKHIGVVDDFSVDNLNELSLNNNSVDLSGWIIKTDKMYTFGFGKYKGKDTALVFKTDKSYFEWILSSETVPADTKIIVRILYNHYSK